MSKVYIIITRSLLALFALCTTLKSHSSQVASEQIIASPHITGWGKWGMWEQCPTGYFVNGMQLKSEARRGALLDDRGLTGIRLFCNGFGEIDQNRKINSALDNVGNWGRAYFCDGLMTGFQLRSEKFQSIFVDDTAGNNLRMFCHQSESDYMEGDGTSFGTWTAKQLCGPKEAVCGISTQIDQSSSWELELDRTGLNNVMMKCCDVPHPVKSCVPNTSWKLLTICGGFGVNSTTEDETCNYTRKIGISYIEGLTSATRLLNEKIGHGISSTSSTFHSKFVNYSSVSEKTQESRTKTDHNYWQFSPNYVWGPETVAKAAISAKKGSKILLYQLHGTCGYYQVWGTKLKKVKYFLNEDGTEHTSEIFIDFTNDDADYVFE